MRYLSVCSGIEAATQAWHPLGWEPVAFSEIEPFPCAVLAHHYPTVPNWGDMTRFQEWPDADVDVLCGGTPCQSFSVAGLRQGLADPRGNLMLTYLAIAARYRPRWLVWENVPGVLSSNSGRDFGTFLGALGQLGYGFSYRVLDAQHVRTRRFPYAVPQRRRRVFVVGYLGDWRRAAAVLFDRESLSGHPAPRRQSGERIAPALTASPASSCSPNVGSGQGAVVEVAGTLTARGPTSMGAPEVDGGNFIPITLDAGVVAAAVAPTLNAHFGDKMGLENQHINGGCGLFVAHSLRGEGFDASEDGTGRGTPLVPVAWSIMPQNSGKDYKARQVDVAQPLMAAGPGSGNQGGDLVQQPVAFDLNQITSPANRSQPDPAVHHTLPATSCPPHLATPWAVRRLTPVECERLQGFPDGFTRIPYRGKPADLCPDGPRYKALGNSWAVNCAEWIGERINEVESIQ